MTTPTTTDALIVYRRFGPNPDTARLMFVHDGLVSPVVWTSERAKAQRYAHATVAEAVASVCGGVVARDEEPT